MAKGTGSSARGWVAFFWSVAISIGLMFYWDVTLSGPYQYAWVRDLEKNSENGTEFGAPVLLVTFFLVFAVLLTVLNAFGRFTEPRAEKYPWLRKAQAWTCILIGSSLWILAGAEGVALYQRAKPVVTMPLSVQDPSHTPPQADRVNFAGILRLDFAAAPDSGDSIIAYVPVVGPNWSPDEPIAFFLVIPARDQGGGWLTDSYYTDSVHYDDMKGGLYKNSSLRDLVLYVKSPIRIEPISTRIQASSLPQSVRHWYEKANLKINLHTYLLGGYRDYNPYLGLMVLAGLAGFVVLLTGIFLFF